MKWVPFDRVVGRDQEMEIFSNENEAIGPKRNLSKSVVYKK